MRLTLADIEAMDDEVLTCDQVGSLLGANPASLRLQARERPGMLGFPVICIGTRVKIPRRPLIKFLKGEEAV